MTHNDVIIGEVVKSSVKLYQEALIRVVLYSKLLKFFDFVSKELECKVQNGQFISN